MGCREPRCSVQPAPCPSAPPPRARHRGQGAAAAKTAAALPWHCGRSDTALGVGERGRGGGRGVELHSPTATWRACACGCAARHATKRCRWWDGPARRRSSSHRRRHTACRASWCGSPHCQRPLPAGYQPVRPPMRPPAVRAHIQVATPLPHPPTSLPPHGADSHQRGRGQAGAWAGGRTAAVAGRLRTRHQRSDTSWCPHHGGGGRRASAAVAAAVT